MNFRWLLSFGQNFKFKLFIYAQLAVSYLLWIICSILNLLIGVVSIFCLLVSLVICSSSFRLNCVVPYAFVGEATLWLNSSLLPLKRQFMCTL